MWRQAARAELCRRFPSKLPIPLRSGRRFADNRSATRSETRKGRLANMGIAVHTAIRACLANQIPRWSFRPFRLSILLSRPTQINTPTVLAQLCWTQAWCPALWFCFSSMNQRRGCPTLRDCRPRAFRVLHRCVSYLRKALLTLSSSGYTESSVHLLSTDFLRSPPFSAMLRVSLSSIRRFPWLLVSFAVS